MRRAPVELGQGVEERLERAVRALVVRVDARVERRVDDGARSYASEHAAQRRSRRGHRPARRRNDRPPPERRGARPSLRPEQRHDPLDRAAVPEQAAACQPPHDRRADEASRPGDQHRAHDGADQSNGIRPSSGIEPVELGRDRSARSHSSPGSRPARRGPGSRARPPEGSRRARTPLARCRPPSCGRTSASLCGRRGARPGSARGCTRSSRSCADGSSTPSRPRRRPLRSRSRRSGRNKDRSPSASGAPSPARRCAVSAVRPGPRRSRPGHLPHHLERAARRCCRAGTAASARAPFYRAPRAGSRS